MQIDSGEAKDINKEGAPQKPGFIRSFFSRMFVSQQQEEVLDLSQQKPVVEPVQIDYAVSIQLTSHPIAKPLEQIPPSIVEVASKEIPKKQQEETGIKEIKVEKLEEQPKIIQVYPEEKPEKQQIKKEEEKEKEEILKSIPIKESKEIQQQEKEVKQPEAQQRIDQVNLQFKQPQEQQQPPPQQNVIPALQQPSLSQQQQKEGIEKQQVQQAAIQQQIDQKQQIIQGTQEKEQKGVISAQQQQKAAPISGKEKTFKLIINILLVVLVIMDLVSFVAIIVFMALFPDFKNKIQTAQYDNLLSAAITLAVFDFLHIFVFVGIFFNLQRWKEMKNLIFIIYIYVIFIGRFISKLIFLFPPGDYDTIDQLDSDFKNRSSFPSDIQDMLVAWKTAYIIEIVDWVITLLILIALLLIIFVMSKPSYEAPQKSQGKIQETQKKKKDEKKGKEKK